MSHVAFDTSITCLMIEPLHLLQVEPLQNQKSGMIDADVLLLVLLEDWSRPPGTEHSPSQGIHSCLMHLPCLGRGLLFLSQR